MDDKLVTLATLTYSKALILKSVLESEGIEAYLHNANQLRPVISSGVRVRIKDKDLPRALEIVNKSDWLSEDIETDKPKATETDSDVVLIPVDFSPYSVKACQAGFHFAALTHSEVVIMHVCLRPSMPTLCNTATSSA